MRGTFGSGCTLVNRNNLWDSLKKGDVESLEYARQLVAKGVNVNFKDENGSTKLHVAAAEGDVKMASSILKLDGVDITMLNKSGKLALDVANAEVARLIIDYAGHSALHFAAAAGNEMQVKRILEILKETGGKIEGYNKAGKTALHLAAKPGVAKMIILSGANINMMDLDSRTPLLVAAANGNVGTFKILLEARAQANVTDKGDRTALYLAAEVGSSEIVKLLLAYFPFSVNWPDRQGFTPLHVAKTEEIKNMIKRVAEKI